MFRPRRYVAAEGLMTMSSTAKQIAIPLADDRVAAIQTEFLDSLTGYRLRHVSNAFMSDFAASMIGTGMRATHVSILSVVEENPGIRQGEIGRALGVARANMAPLMAELESLSLLERVPDEIDRRAVSVYLTKDGQVTLKNCKARIAAHERRSLSPLSPAERDTLLRILKKL